MLKNSVLQKKCSERGGGCWIDIHCSIVESKFDIDDPKFVEIDRFRIEFMNFADDRILGMKPLLSKCKLDKVIKYNYRLNLQSSISNFFYWTRFYQLVLAKVKCNTVTFSRKKYFHAYVCKLDGDKLELVHSHSNAPQKCKHNEQLQYFNPFDELSEGNGDSDLDNMDENGNKIRNDNNVASNDPKHPMFRIQRKGTLGKLQKQSKNNLPDSVRILGVFFDPELYFKNHLKIVLEKAEKKLHCLMKLAFCKYYKFGVVQK